MLHHCFYVNVFCLGTGVTCYALHPGNVKTDLTRHMDDLSHMPCFWRAFVRFAWFAYYSRTRLTPLQGAQTTIYCSIAPELAEVSGKYYS